MEVGLMRKAVRVLIHTSNGNELRGTLIIERDVRLSDVLNNSKKEFVVMLDEDNHPHILNKQHIMEVIEIAE